MRKRIVNIILLGFLLVSIPAASDLISKTYTFSPNTLIKSAEVNTDFDQLFSEINGNLNTANIKDSAINSAKIANGAVAQVDMACAGYWDTLTFCDGNEQNADSAHRHDAGYITFSGGATYTATFLDDALFEIADYTGYSAGATGTTTTAMRFIGYATGAANTTSITVATDTMSAGITASISGFLQIADDGGTGCVLCIPLSINSTPLSSAGAQAYRYTVCLGTSNQSAEMYASSDVVYVTADGWDGAVTNTVELGAAYLRGGVACNTSSSSSDYVLILNGLN